MRPTKSPSATPSRLGTSLLLSALVSAVLSACGGTSSSSAPTLGSSNPSQSATNVPTSTVSATNVVSAREVTATFNRPMDPDSISSSPAGTRLTFTLRETEGNDVPGTVSMNGANAIDAANMMATFKPTASALAPNTHYTATVTTSAKDAQGMAMASPVSWSFTTKAAAFTGQAPVNLGLTCNFTIFADTGIANASAPAAIDGDMGVGPGVTSTAITGPWALNLPAASAFSTSDQVMGKIYAFDYAPPTPTMVTTASTDMLAAYNDAAGRSSPDVIGLGGGSLDGQLLTAGLYRWNSDVTLSVGATVTLAGGFDDIWILQITGTLATGAHSMVVLTGGAQASNIFWQVAGSSVAMGANSHFEGTVLAKFAINVVNQASITGKLLAQTAVNLDENSILGTLCPCGRTPTTARTGGSASPRTTAYAHAKSVPASAHGRKGSATARERTAPLSQAMDPKMIHSSASGSVLTFAFGQNTVTQSVR